ncbi:MAG: lytic transglycosylase domain-containing protein [Nitrospirae bacterium]|nr:lytic transglycosylase domain-containing protein [Nitrospirota bacterium]
MYILRVFLGLLFIALLFLPAYMSADADIYKYTGDDGVVIYTDAPLGKQNEKIIAKNKKESESNKQHEIKTYSEKNKSVYHPIVSKKAQEYAMDPSLVSAVIKAESNGNPHAVSRKGAMGLMQLMPMTAMDLQVKNPFDPEENIDGGTRYLRYLLEKFNGDLTLALAAYNAGPKTVEKYGAVPPIIETKQYVKRVLSLYNGKTENPAPVSQKTPKSEPIYKIIMEDGTILFTNFPLHKTNSVRF